VNKSDTRKVITNAVGRKRNHRVSHHGGKEVVVRLDEKKEGDSNHGSYTVQKDDGGKETESLAGAIKECQQVGRCKSGKLEKKWDWETFRSRGDSW